MLFQSEDIVGYPVSYESIGNIVSHITGLIQSRHRSCCYFGCLNPHAVEMAAGDSDFKAALLEADFLTADGVGIVYASRLFGGRIQERVTGMDIFEVLTAAMNAAGGMSCYFLGATEETLQKIQERMAKEYPRVRVAGTYSPPFRPAFDTEDTREMILRINASDCDVLWVGLTAPKQEKWIHQNRHKLNVTFAGPIGAVFDFYAGSIKRAGSGWQKFGLEWLPRLLQEPRRLWRRNFVSSPAFLMRCVRYRFSHVRSEPQE